MHRRDGSNLTVRVGGSRALRRAAVRATLAPSIQNTQPWRFVVDTDLVEVRGDFARRLPVADPVGRQLAISCGCALFNIRVSLAHDNFGSAVADRDPVALAVVTPTSVRQVEFAPIALLDSQIERRHTNRGPFFDVSVPPWVVDDLVSEADLEGGILERTAETTRFEEPDDARYDIGGELFVLASREDTPRSWLHIGEALERVLLRCTQLGYCARPASGVIEDPEARLSLQRESRSTAFPHVSLRIGRASSISSTRRRKLVDVIDNRSTT